jgi:hydrogenase nickel incorporation protein HypA/HybF
MHELSLAMEIIDLVRPSIPEGESLKSVQVTVGLLAGVCSDSLQFCFTELTRIEGYPDARLKMVLTPARYHCVSCDLDYEVQTVEQVCPVCGSMTRTMLGGTELSIDFIEV